MSVDKRISLSVLKKELEESGSDPRLASVNISDLDAETLKFGATMISPIDGEKYILEFDCNDYPQIPPYIEFLDPTSGERGTKNAYPKNPNFFHGLPCICNPCSRKAYMAHGGPHGEWTMIDWKKNPKTNGLKTIDSILCAIYIRICKKELYNGRMK